MRQRQRLGAGLLIAVFIACSVLLFPIETGAQSKTVGSNVTMEVDAPAVVRRAVPFPVAVTVTNRGEKGRDLVVGELRLRAGNKVLQQKKVNLKLAAIGTELQDLERKKTMPVRQNENDLGRLVQLKNQVKQGKKVFKLYCDPGQMAEEFKPGRQLRLSLEADLLPASSAGQTSPPVKKTVMAREKTITIAPPLERPSVPPGASHSDWYFGDTHSHSTYTWDYWFGNGIYTIPELKSLAQAAGLDWLNLTDHSYCLDESKFQEIKNQTTALSDGEFSFLNGEELSVREIKDKTTSDLDTAHYATILNETFIPSETNLLRQAYAPNSQEGIDQTKSAGGLVVINHPQWGDRTIEPWNFNLKTYPWTHGETAMELINGPWDDPDLGSTTRWIEQRLLKGEKVAAVGASDTESKNRLGTAMTVTYAAGNTRQDIKTALSQQRQYATTGPGIGLWARSAGEGTWHWMGETVAAGSSPVEIYVSTAWSDGSLEVKVMRGQAGASAEETVDTRMLSPGAHNFTLTTAVEPGSYLRVQAVDPAASGYRAYGTPIWFN